jgi:hydrogenase maturation protease
MMRGKGILVGGIGNVFFGDDAFGVEVVRRLRERSFPADVHVVDFGVRGFDLACALVDGYDTAILVDVTQRGERPGTLYVIDPTRGPSAGDPPRHVDGHGLDPVAVLALAQALGGVLPEMRLVGCEPERMGDGEEDLGLSDSVRAALEPAMALVESLVSEAREAGLEALRLRSGSNA